MHRLAVCAALFAGLFLHAGDWPEWRGAGRTGVWKETNIVDRFASAALTPKWRTPLGGGFAGPAVAAGRIYVTDYVAAAGNKGAERAHCLDERTGKILWTREWPASYQGISYAYGPRATPTVDSDRVYVVGASGILLCLNARTGAILWQKDYVRDYGATLPVWGIAGAPIVDGNRLIAVVGGQPDAKVVAFDKLTGKELWRSLPSDTEQGYSQPLLIESSGVRQLIVWHPAALSSLDPATGKPLWQEPFRINLGVALASPVFDRARLLVTSFYNGSLLMHLDGAHAKKLWQGKSASEINTDGLHSVVNTPVIDGDYIYGICSYGQFRCLNAKTGERVWETLEVTKEKARWASGFIVRNGDRYFINNDRGELIIARLSPKGYQEISRAQLIKPTSNPGNRRELGMVNWSHPAYANRHVYARNDEEIIAVPLAQ
ncbi:MAG: PQQ-binding-like beta-propeller repeat protein [Acidobacteria bacterium]|nr:PQQ-binding-like beta-propeller repeat protein [Acidobacteriota bacterium]